MGEDKNLCHNFIFVIIKVTVLKFSVKSSE